MHRSCGCQKTGIRDQVSEVSEWARRFEDLDVFRRAYALSLEVHRASLDFPRIEQFALADQVRRASKSICANLAEGFGRQRLSKPEFRRFLLWPLVLPTRCRFGCCTAAISAMSTRRRRSVGGASTMRSP